MMSSIGSTTIDKSACPLLHDPLAAPFDELESKLSLVFGDDDVNTIRSTIGAIQATRGKRVSKDHLSKIWVIPQDLANSSINQTTQLFRHHADKNISRQFSTNDSMLQYKRIQNVLFTDTLVVKTTPSNCGNRYAQLYVSEKGFTTIYPMKSQYEFIDTLHCFCKEIEVPTTLVMDGHQPQTNHQTRKFSSQVGLTMRVLEEHTPWANRYKLYTSILKEAVHRDLRLSH